MPENRAASSHVRVRPDHRPIGWDDDGRALDCAGCGQAWPCSLRSRAVWLDEFDRQRALGWPDFHPEDYCHRCGHRNVSWFTSAERWAEAEIAGLWNEIVCPQCFAELWEMATGRRITWEMSVDGDQ